MIIERSAIYLISFFNYTIFVLCTKCIENNLAIQIRESSSRQAPKIFHNDTVYNVLYSDSITPCIDLSSGEFRYLLIDCLATSGSKEGVKVP